MNKLTKDLPASIVVFLVALPLCLGIALASGAPLLSGIVSGIIGGIVVGFLSGSHASVSGPAAGLAAVVLAAITQLGSFEIFLLAVMLAGVFQVIGGFAKTGFVADFIPSVVIKGLLAAIGIILILKQIPHALGLDSDIEGDFSFIQADGKNTFSELLGIFSLFNTGALIISALSLLALIYWDRTPMRKLSFFPSSLFVVLLGVFLNFLFGQYLPQFYINPTHLVQIPAFTGLSSFIVTPAFGQIANFEVWTVAFTIAIIASLETLLNLEAVENIDPHKRKASPDRELIAQGIGNIGSGLLGGLPITSVIVRSSVNINAGSESKLSAIMHGVFLLLSVVLISPLLNLIPLASLAAILLVTGYKLTKISLFKKVYKSGLNQFIPFVATIVAILFTDLLVGILIGLCVSIFYLLKSNFHNPFILEKEELHVGETIRLELSNQVSFLNKGTIKETLWGIPENSNVIIDATYSDFVDNDILELITDFKEVVSVDRNIQLNVLGLKEKYQLDDHIQFVNVMDKERQQALKPDEVLDLLKAGNERFVKGKWTEKYFKHQVNATSFGQNPMVAIISCIDSRTSPEFVFDLGIGDLLSIRIAGNVINREIIESLELAFKKIGIKLIVVMGHSNCGAISTAVEAYGKGDDNSIFNKVNQSIEACGCAHKVKLDDKEFDQIVRHNVGISIRDILTQSEYLKSKLEEGEVDLIPAFYDTSTGVVQFDK